MSRADSLMTHLLVPGAEICVPESQRSQYEARLERDSAKINRMAAFSHGRGPKVITHPDSVKGLTKKLNWCLFNLADPECLVFLDDDIPSVQRTFVEPGEESTIKDPLLVEAIIRNTFDLALDLGAFFFGWEPAVGGVRYYTGLEPVKLTGYINGCAKGFVTGHGLHYDERIVAKEDYDISAQNAIKHRLCLRNSRYAFMQKDTFVGTGGLSAFRTSQTEKKDVEILRRKYGPAIKTTVAKGTRKSDYAGVSKITLHLPF